MQSGRSCRAARGTFRRCRSRRKIAPRWRRCSRRWSRRSGATAAWPGRARRRPPAGPSRRHTRREPSAMSLLSWALAVAVLLGVLILVHELGHFVFARLFDVKVLRFSLGFGPRVFSFTHRETEYRLSLVPLGGYVRLLGEDPGEPIPPI